MVVDTVRQLVYTLSKKQSKGIQMQITIKNDGSNKFLVIGRNLEVTENSRTDMSTYFYADCPETLSQEINKLKTEYSLNTTKGGLNSKGEKIIQLTK